LRQSRRQLGIQYVARLSQQKTEIETAGGRSKGDHTPSIPRLFDGGSSRCRVSPIDHFDAAATVAAGARRGYSALLALARASWSIGSVSGVNRPWGLKI